MFDAQTILMQGGFFNDDSEKSNDNVAMGDGRFHLTDGRMPMMLRVLLLTIEFHKLFKTLLRNLLPLRIK
ncbi:hypothetical protein HNR31_000328 [Anoxybacillus caldiproteolyticus]|uniref:Uncharacterized protein n=1 Tax=Thermaerobacillus caldiproteolyticus TaxID=247480 RepID=A0A7W0BWL9_9BACL|nr:hypothetical protein [Anoxybacillus caldiproteolyticus]